jgi:hypothetical protein
LEYFTLPAFYKLVFVFLNIMGCAKSKDGMVVETNPKYNVQVSNKKPEGTSKPSTDNNSNIPSTNTEKSNDQSSSPPKEVRRSNYVDHRRNNFSNTPQRIV